MSLHPFSSRRRFPYICRRKAQKGGGSGEPDQPVEPKNVTIQFVDGGVLVENAHVTKTEIKTPSGVIHVIDVAPVSDDER